MWRVYFAEVFWGIAVPREPSSTMRAFNNKAARHVHHCARRVVERAIVGNIKLRSARACEVNPGGVTSTCGCTTAQMLDRQHLIFPGSFH